MKEAEEIMKTFMESTGDEYASVINMAPQYYGLNYGANVNLCRRRHNEEYLQKKLEDFLSAALAK